MNWLLTGILCAILVELVLRLPFLDPLEAVRRTGRRALHLVTTTAVSDHWKEKAMGAYARQTFAASAQVAGLLAIVLGAAAVLVLGLDRLSHGFQRFIVSWTGLGGSLVAATLYVVARGLVVRG